MPPCWKKKLHNDGTRHEMAGCTYLWVTVLKSSLENDVSEVDMVLLLRLFSNWKCKKAFLHLIWFFSPHVNRAPGLCMFFFVFFFRRFLPFNLASHVYKWLFSNQDWKIAFLQSIWFYCAWTIFKTKMEKVFSFLMRFFASSSRTAFFFFFFLALFAF